MAERSGLSSGDGAERSWKVAVKGKSDDKIRGYLSYLLK